MDENEYGGLGLISYELNIFLSKNARSHAMGAAYMSGEYLGFPKTALLCNRINAHARVT